ncbi:LURP-one-related/scramblase family protein [Holdemanella biformis]|uniref:LURP-one-related/scramblase family protein n=1 Tax=Holdemanella biformis TaxID=1735 RepID=UPI003AB491AA
MKLLFKQRFFSWFDSYDTYNEDGQVIYQVEGKLSWGHKLVIYDQNGNEVGTVLEKVITLLPKFEIYKNNEYIGCLSKELSFFIPHYNIDYNGWHIDGTLTEWNYTIVDESYDTVAIIRKEIFNFTDTYVIDVKDPENALDALMFVLAIDAEKCTRNKRQNH